MIENNEELQLEEIGKLVKEGYTSGRLDKENGECLWWDMKIERWKD